MPKLLDEFENNPTSSLVTISCWPWSRYSKAVLVGDASHAVVPFYGQGMNAGFEDVRVLIEQIDKYNGNWEEILPAYQNLRKPDADAIQELAMANFEEMRSQVADDSFLLRKKDRSRAAPPLPRAVDALYSMVTFSNQRYSDALKRGKQQTKIMDNVMQQQSLEQNWESLDFEAIVDQLEKDWV